MTATKPKSFFARYVIAFSAFACVFLFTVFTFISTHQRDTNRKRELFQNRVDDIEQTIHRRFKDYIQILKAGRGLFLANDTVTREEFYAFYKTLELERNFPGILGFGYSQLIDGELLEAHEKHIRTEFPDYKVRPFANREIYTSIIYIEPFDRINIRAFGYDMYSESVRKAAMRRAMIDDSVTVSGQVTLVQETKDNPQPGFLIYMPVYKVQNPHPPERDKMIKGWIYAPFRSYDLLNNLLREYEDLNVKVSDASDINKVLYSSIKGEDDNDLSEIHTINVARAHWRIHISAVEGFGALPFENQPYLIFIAGILISIVVSLLIGKITRLQFTANKLSTAKDDFIGIASHELKTPLTSAKAYIQLAERAAAGNDFSKVQKLIKKSERSIENLGQLINDLLDVSKIQAGKLAFHLVPMDINKTVTDVVEKFRLLSSTHIITLDGFVEELVCADPQRIEQVLDNLMSNAIKYSPKANKINVDISSDGNSVLVSVRDYGVGIPAEKQSRIFERFFRVDDYGKFSGLGLGLFISNEITKRHKGKITVKSEPGAGSTFTLTLPVMKDSRVKTGLA